MKFLTKSLLLQLFEGWRGYNAGRYCIYLGIKDIKKMHIRILCCANTFLSKNLQP